MDAKDEVKARLSVEDVIAEYIELRPSGRNMKGLSPFTPEKTPSFMVSPEKQIWHDFSSAKGGDMFSFVMEMEGIDFRAALELLARKAGVELKQYNSEKSGETAKLKTRLIAAHELAVDYYQHQLIKSPQALEYLKNRGYTKQTIIDFKLGYAPNNHLGLHDYLTEKGYSLNELTKAGLVGQRNGDKYDIFRNRITVPLADGQGQHIGFTARLLVESDKAPKYLNTPQTLIYDKSRHVFGLHLAKDAIRKADEAVITEGNMDVVASHQANVKKVVASAGTALTTHHFKQLERLSRNIKLAFDSDRAGLEATERAIALAQQHKLNLSVITIDGGKDPDELIMKDLENGKSSNNSPSWEQAIRKSDYAFDWLIKHYSAVFDINTTPGKKAFSSKMVEVLGKITDEVEIDDIAAKLSKVLGIDKAAILRKLDSAKSTGSKIRLKPMKVDLSDISKPDQTDVIVDTILAFALRDPTVASQLDKLPEGFISEDQQTLAKYLKEHNKAVKSDSLPAPLKKISDYVNILLFKTEELYGEFDNDQLLAESKKLRLRLNQLIKNKHQQKLSNEIKKAEGSGDLKTAQKYLNDLNDLLKKE